MYPYSNPSLIAKGLSFFKTIKWGEFLDGTQKTLNVINQAIPVVYQVKPMMNNAKTLFKIANIMKNPDNTVKDNTISNNELKQSSPNNSPIFYI